MTTSVIGLLAAWITFLQYKVNRDKLRLDLFSKRLEAYEKLQEFYTAVFREGCVKDAMLPVLAEARYKSRFLFGPEIETTFTKTWKKAVEMRRLQRQLYGSGTVQVGQERSVIVDKESALLEWMMAEMETSPKRYSKYLHFK